MKPGEYPPSEAGRYYIEMQVPFISFLLSVGYIKTQEEYVTLGYAAEFERWMQTLKAKSFTSTILKETILKLETIINQIRDGIRRNGGS